MSGEADGANQVKNEFQVATVKPKMSASEAKARILPAAAARVISEEQMRMVNGSEIVGAENLDAIHNQLAQLPADELMLIVEQLVLDPANLGEENLANLASLLGSRHMELEVRKESEP